MVPSVAAALAAFHNMGQEACEAVTDSSAADRDEVQRACNASGCGLYHILSSLSHMHMWLGKAVQPYLGEAEPMIYLGGQSWMSINYRFPWRRPYR